MSLEKPRLRLATCNLSSQALQRDYILDFRRAYTLDFRRAYTLDFRRDYTLDFRRAYTLYQGDPV